MGKSEDSIIDIKTLVEIRKDEMESILPGFYTQIVVGDEVIEVKSPDASERR